MTSAESSLEILKTKPHFEILDGLRGVAAIAVVIFHFMEIIVPDSEKNFIAHGYLAVDFFFCLSGFVLAYAYDSRIEQLGLLNFLKLRLIRLHPLVLIGSVLGLLVFILDPLTNLYAIYGLGKGLVMFVTSCFLIPYPVVRERYFNIFHLNPPTWSLFWEYVANIVYASFLFRITNKVLGVLVVIAAAVLFYACFRAGNLSIGWSGETFWGGGARVGYSFLVGMLAYRANWVTKYRLGFVLMSVLLVAAFLFPFVNKLNWLTEPAIVLFYFPLLVVLGAGAHLSPRFHKVCKFSGDISYPLYMTHYPFIWLFLSYMEQIKPSINELKIVVPISCILLIGLAYVIMIFVDIPIRRYLKNKLV